MRVSKLANERKIEPTKKTKREHIKYLIKVQDKNLLFCLVLFSVRLFVCVFFFILLLLLSPCLRLRQLRLFMLNYKQIVTMPFAFFTFLLHPTTHGKHILSTQVQHIDTEIRFYKFRFFPFSFFALFLRMANRTTKKYKFVAMQLVVTANVKGKEVQYPRCFDEHFSQCFCSPQRQCTNAPKQILIMHVNVWCAMNGGPCATQKHLPFVTFDAWL